jgi:hypothetical protein
MIEIKTKPVNKFLINAVLDTLPIPERPMFGDKPLSLGRIESDEWKNRQEKKLARDAWIQFTEEVNLVLKLRAEKLTRLFLTRGLEFDVPPIEEWGDDLLDYDVQNLSSGSIKLLYLHEILPEPGKKLELLLEVMDKSGMQSGIMAGIREMFTDALNAASGIQNPQQLEFEI